MKAALQEFKNLIGYNEYSTRPLMDLVNQKLVDCLPGVFYIYELSETDAQIKVWNKNHEFITGYNTEECRDKSVFFFIDKNSHAAIADGLQNIREEGYVNKVYANIRSKKGILLPYVFEGYKFMVTNRSYLMGLGLDVSELVDAKEQVRLLSLEKRRKERELLSLVMQDEKKEQLLRTVLDELVSIRNSGLDQSKLQAIESLTQEIKGQFKIQGNWQQFTHLFNNIHHGFFDGLNEKHPNISRTELQYCAYVKIQMSPLQICEVMNISMEGLTKKRYRLKKKFDLSKGKNLDTYILSF